MNNIIFENVSVTLGDKVVFKDFFATFSGGEITCILGASGVGKTTVLNLVSNSVKYEGKVETGGGAVSYMFQDERLVPSLSVVKNLELVLKSKIASKIEREKMIDDILEKVELSGEKNNYPFKLSGGMARRVALARAFVYPSEILLMDEAFTGADAALKSRLISLFLKLYSLNKKTVVYVTHSIDEALLLSHRVIVIAGSPATIVLDEKIPLDIFSRTLTDTSLDDIRRKLLAAVMDNKK